MENKSGLKILTVEDEDIIRNNIATYLEDSGFTVFQAANGRAGLAVFKKEQPDLVLLDLHMPEMNGLDFLSAIRDDHKDVPVIIVSGTGSIKDAIHALRFGAWDFVTKPIQEMAVLDYSIDKALERARLIKENTRYRRYLEDEIKKRTAEIEVRSQELEQLNEMLKNEIRERIFAEDMQQKTLESLERSIEGTIRTISYIGEIRDPYTAGHQNNVAVLSSAIGSEMNLPAEQVRGVYVSGMLHDIGKIGVPIEILTKPGTLSNLDYLAIKQHPLLGYEILKKVTLPWPVADIVLQHHERLDGSGYPGGLKNGEILIEAKIICVADVVEGMSSHRPYRPAIGIDMALGEIIKGKDLIYDGTVVDACLMLFREKNFNYKDRFETHW